jgi:hypothetical protein
MHGSIHRSSGDGTPSETSSIHMHRIDLSMDPWTEYVPAGSFEERTVIISMHAAYVQDAYVRTACVWNGSMHRRRAGARIASQSAQRRACAGRLHPGRPLDCKVRRPRRRQQAPGRSRYVEAGHTPCGLDVYAYAYA